MNEKEAIKTLNGKIEWLLTDLEFYIDDGKYIAESINVVLQALKDKENRIDELEKALVNEDLKHRNEIKKCEEENKKYLNAIKSILLNIPSNEIEISNKDIVQAEKYYVVVERNVINNSQKLCLCKGEY